MKYSSALAGILLLLASAYLAPAHAQNVVHCESIKNQYSECDAPWRSARLLEQSSRAPCIAGESWGFNATTRRLWVAQGCRGTFTNGSRAQASGRSNAIMNAYIAEEERKERERQRREAEAAAGCHGVGCYVDNPDAPAAGYADPASAPVANPDFDANGNYIGCSGVGCYITNPDAP